MNTKKILFFIVAINLLPFLLTPAMAGIPSAQDAANTLAQDSPVKINSPQDIFNILSNIAIWTYRAFFAVAIFFILLAAFNFLFARGDPGKITAARSEILWAVVAIAIALISVAAAQIILSFINQ